jgi:hypothetical protein
MKLLRDIPSIPPANVVWIEPKNLIDVAWSFAHSMLYKERQLPEDEIQKAKCFLKELFCGRYNSRRFFYAFCERILLADGYYGSRDHVVVPPPSKWFTYDAAQEGFAETAKWYECLRRLRRKNYSYMHHLTIVAKHYYYYAFFPCGKIITNCKEELKKAGAIKLLSAFDKAIDYLKQIM